MSNSWESLCSLSLFISLPILVECFHFQVQKPVDCSVLKRIGLKRGASAVLARMDSGAGRIRVVGGVATRSDSVFMAQRPEGKAHAGLWEFPGGKVEQGESDEDALCRELEEELRIKVKVGSFIAKGQDGKVKYVFLLHYFPSSRLEEQIDLFGYQVEFMGEPILAEHAACRWVPLSQLGELPVPPADVPIINEVRRLRESAGYP